MEIYVILNNSLSFFTYSGECLGRYYRYTRYKHKIPSRISIDGFLEKGGATEWNQNLPKS